MKMHRTAVLLALLILVPSPGRLSGGALYLDGINDIVTFPGTGIPSGGSAFTIEAWINPTTIPAGGANGGQITFWGNQSANQANGFRLRGSTGTRHFFWSNDHDENFGIDILPDTTGPNSDGWHHLAITFDGTQTRWYWNGVLLGNPRPVNAGVNVVNANHRIGSRIDAEFFHGFIDELRIWNRARTATEISDNRDRGMMGNEANLVAYWDFEGNFGDRAGGDNNGTPVGDAFINANVNSPIQTSGPRITSFTASPSPVYEAGTLTFSWVIDATAVSGTLAVTILGESNTVLHTTSSATGSQPIIIGSTAGQTKTVTYTLRASESGGAMVTRQATVDVQLLPGIPVAHPQEVALVINNPASVTLTGTDPNNQPLTFRVVTPPAHGSLSGTPPTVVYTPAVDYFGNDFFSFVANDGSYDSAPASVAIRIEREPTPPTAIILSRSEIPSTLGPNKLAGALRSVDANSRDTHTYALVSGAGDTHNNLFSISNNFLVTKPGFTAQPGTTINIRLRSTDSTGLEYEQAFALPVVVPAPGVVINEIHYNPADNTVQEEFVELFNVGTQPVDLSHWRLRGGVDFDFAPGTAIAGGGFLVIAASPATILSRYGVTAFGPLDGRMNNDGDRVSLRDNFDNVIDEVEYRSEFPWPIAANGSGGSMELLNPEADNNLGSSWRTPLNPARPSPGKTNQVLVFNAAPNIRQVDHSPNTPTSTNAVKITAKVTDPEGVDSVLLHYQVVAPGQYIPAFFPLPYAELNATPFKTHAPNPAFEDRANWTTVVMVDNGQEGDEVAGDDIYTVLLPPQANRTLLRYRITVTDLFGASARAPFAEDESLNFACFVYDGIPDYLGVSAEVLESLPIYWLITRAEDMTECNAYNAALQIPQFNGSIANEARYIFNWPGTLVYDGKVYDHIKYRLRGANGRYQPGKRNHRIRFNEGHLLEARDQYGKRYPTKWGSLNTGKGQSNRQNVTWGFNEVVNYYLWNTLGVPAPNAFFFHFRVVSGAAEAPDQYGGDFWGINWAQENFDVRFLEAHNLPKGNLYKLINARRDPDDYQDALKQQRYQAPFAVTNGGDAVNIERNLTGSQSTEWLLAHVNYPNWYRYHAICEAVRNYDFWPSANKNAAWYFEPVYTSTNQNYGRMWTFPWDSDSSWGPTWNLGHDVAYNGIFPSSATGGDSGQNPTLQLEYRNTVREVRDLLWQPEQIDPLLEAFAKQIREFVPADLARWSNAPVGNGRYTSLAAPGPGLSGGMDGYLGDMRKFAWVGGSWPGDSGSIGSRAAHLDQLVADAAIPATPTITYAGGIGYPATALIFQSSTYSDPQGSATFGAIQWRVAEVNSPTDVINDPRDFKLEWNAVWDSGELPVFINRAQVPAIYVKPGQFYRARVRHKDNSGRWSRWSAPLEFVPAAVDVVSVLRTNLAITEIMYHPQADGLYDPDDFEYLELQNRGAVTLDLGGLYFSAGIDFAFPLGTTLGPGEFFLLARNPLMLPLRHPGVVVNGDYGGNLNNAGETITLTHPYGVDILKVTYGDDPPEWPVTPDGLGFSLALEGGAWRASAQPGGSPAAVDPPVSRPGIVINEVLTASESPAVDVIELQNPTAQNVDISGWFLSDDNGMPRKFRIPDNTALAPGEFVVFDENQFNPAPGTTNSFSLSSLGESVYLFSADTNGTLTGYSHGFSFIGAQRGVSFGRHFNSAGVELFPPQLAFTPGTNNAGPLVGPVVFSEIHYNPPPQGDEFIELLNRSGDSVTLFDPNHPTNTWRVSGAAFTFPTNVTLGAGERVLLVGIEPDDFRARHGIPAQTRIFGPYLGNLQGSGEWLRWLAPDAPTTNGVAYYAVDEVRYNDKAPWPVAADGAGPSLQRSNPADYGTEPLNWFAALPTPSGLVVSPNAPIITAAPLDQLAYVGQSVSLQVDVQAALPVFYQWRFNGSLLAGETNAILQLTDLQADHSGQYDVDVFNAFGATSSPPATLRVLVPPVITQQPQMQAVRLPASAAFAVDFYGTPPFALQWQRNGQDIPGANGPRLDFPSVTLEDQGDYRVLITDASATVTSVVASLIVLVNPVIVQPPASQVLAVGSPLLLEVEVTGTQPIGYRWRRNSVTIVAFEEGTNFLAIPHVSLEDGGRYDVIATNLARTSGVGSLPAYVTVVQPPGNRMVLTGANVTLSAIVSGSGTHLYRWQYDGTDIAGATSTNLVLTNVQSGQSGTYTIAVSNTVSKVVNYFSSQLTVQETATPPEIVKQPADVTALVGGAAAFAVESIGTEPLQYQWWFNETNLLADATNALLTLGSVQPTDLGGYTVTVANQAGIVTSVVAALSLPAPPSIIVQPVDQTVAEGGMAMFTVVSEGTPPLTYQWWYNGTEALPGATEATLTLANVQAANAGGYQAVVANSAGAVTSTVAQLTLSTGDRDGDGLPDDYELAHGLNPDNPADGDADSDRDGLTNAQEYRAGTNPTNAASVLKLEMPLVTVSGDAITLQFNAVSNRSYRIEYRERIDLGSWQEAFSLEAAPSNRAVGVTTNLNSSLQRYYRIATPKP